MTKQWDVYETTIKNLYAENTLAVVRQIMIDRYGFKASVRAYRGRLIRWGIRKYNCRKRASSSSSGSCGSTQDSSFSNSSDTTSPPMSYNNMARTVPQGAGGHLAMPGQIPQRCIYNPIDNHQVRMYNTQKTYDIKPKPVLSPPQPQMNGTGNSGGNMDYAWDSASPPLPRPKRLSDSPTSSPDFDTFNSSGNHNHNNSNGTNNGSPEIMAPSTYFNGFSGPVSIPMSAMGQTNNAHNHRQGQDHGNGGPNPYASIPNAEYLRHRDSGSSAGSYYDGAGYRDTPMS